MFKIGDKVVVVDPRYNESSDSSLNLITETITIIPSIKDFEGVVFTVKAKTFQKGSTLIAYLIEDEDYDQFIFGEGGLKAYEEPNPITEEELVQLWRDNDYHMVFIRKETQRAVTGYAKENNYPFELGLACENYETLLTTYTHYWTKSTGKKRLDGKNDG